MDILNENSAAYIIFGVTIALSLFILYVRRDLFDKFALDPYSISRGKKYPTILVSGFIHANLTHLLFNMLTFYFFAFNLCSIVGGKDFLIIYLTSLIIANLPSIVKHKNNPAYRSIGASGAISGVLFSFILFSPNSTLMIFPIPFPLPAYIFAVLYLIWSYFAAKQSGDFINHDAHFWGAIAGIIITILLIPDSISIFLSNF
ncbi:MAG: rhomboid family intramembrane serine protease [Ignavibacteria bacterium GWF2_33_9]|nr:MAG: rhomboid family intramembrane serine protease [Ignavibacteria bacterium GWF2_33_9]